MGWDSSQDKRGMLFAMDAGGSLAFQYNPEEIRDRSVAKWAGITINGSTNNRLQYTSGEGRTISFTTKMYHADKSGKTPGERIRWLHSLTYPDTGGGMPTRPPTRVALSMGPDYPGIVCVCTEVDATITEMASSTLHITAAEVSISLVQFTTKALSFQDIRG